MFDSVVIDVAIALGLTFFVFSLVVSGIREIVARALETRSKEMWRALRTLLDDPVTSGLRELRAAADRLKGEARASFENAIASAEATIRSHLDAGETGPGWKAKVDAALAGVGRAAAGDAAIRKLVKRTAVRFTSRHATGRRFAAGVVNAARRGGDRPLVAPGSPPSVPELAGEVVAGTRTLTDAIHDHPVVRQADRTWRGFHSRMQRLDTADFTSALIDLVRAAGIAPSLKEVFTGVARAINRLPVDDAAKQQLWERVKNGWTEAQTVLRSAVPRVEDIDDVFAGVRSAVDDLLESGGPGLDLDDDARTALEASLDGARRDVAGLVTDPMRLVRAGANQLQDTVSAKQVLQRLAAEAEYAVADIRARVEVVRDSLGDWYDRRMDSLSAWYRKRSRFVAFGLGLAVAVVFNVDAVRMPQELWQNENVRSVVVSLAERTGLDVSGCVNGGTTDSSNECVEDRVDELIETGVPVGWDWGTDCGTTCDGLGERIAHASGVGGEGSRAALLKLLGWLAAAGALSIGASFWYDVLRRATGIKGRAVNPGAVAS